MSQQNCVLFGRNPKFIQVIEAAETVAVSKSPVLITGEKGTGKKTLCYFIHQNSVRKDKPFMVVDCSQDPQSVRNEILGYRDDANGKFIKGVFERANGGTVVLSHIEDLEENFQDRLYTVIQELSDYGLDLRLIATTSKNLAKYVGAGNFSRPLYSFFSLTTLGLPSLRERKEDVELLVSNFITILAGEVNRPVPTISPEAMDKFRNEYWSGNVAELKEAVTKCFNSCTGDSIHFVTDSGNPSSQHVQPFKMEGEGIQLMSLRDAEQLLIRKALMFTSENRTQAAKILGVSIRTLRNKINEYRVAGDTFFTSLR